MGHPAAKQGDRVVGTDTHVVLVPNPSGPPTPTPLPHPYAGALAGGLSNNVRILGHAAAIVGSTAANQPPHQPAAPGNAFQKPPSNQATVRAGSASVRINGKPAARDGDAADTCNDPADRAAGRVVAAGSVRIG